MEIFVSRDCREFGPYTLDDVNAYLASGELSGDDIAWYDGAADWMPLRSMEGVKAPSNSPSEQRPNPSEKDADGVTQLAAIAKCRTHLRLVVACMIFVGGAVFAVFGEGSPVGNLSVVTGAVFLFITVYRLAKAIRSPVAWLYCVLLLLPLVNLITVLVLERKASNLIKQGGGQKPTRTSTGSKIAIGALILVPIIAVIGVLYFIVFGDDKPAGATKQVDNRPAVEQRKESKTPEPASNASNDSTRLQKEIAMLTEELTERRINPTEMKPALRVQGGGVGFAVGRQLFVVEADKNSVVVHHSKETRFRVTAAAIGVDKDYNDFLNEVTQHNSPLLLFLVRPDGWNSYVRGAAWAEHQFKLATSKMPILGQGRVDLSDFEKFTQLANLTPQPGQEAISGLLSERDSLRAALDKTPVPKGPPPVLLRVPVAKPVPAEAVMYRVLCMSNKVYLISDFGWRTRVWSELEKAKQDLLHEKQPSDPKAGPLFDHLKTVKWLNERKFTDAFVELKFPLDTNSMTNRVSMLILPRADGGESPERVGDTESNFCKTLLKLSANPKSFCWFLVHPTGVSAYHAAREQCSLRGIPAGWEFYSATSYGENLPQFAVNRLRESPPPALPPNSAR